MLRAIADGVTRRSIHLWVLFFRNAHDCAAEVFDDGADEGVGLDFVEQFGGEF